MANRDGTSLEFVYRSTYLHEVELVADQLNQAGIAYIRAVEQTGMRFAMPIASGVAAGPASSFLVVVRPPHAERARALVRSLPESQDE
jgi:hypothetical protein